MIKDSDKLVYLDSSFLISLLVENHPLNKKAQEINKKAVEKDLHPCISILTFDETIFHLQKYQSVSKNRFLVSKFIKQITALPFYYIQPQWNPLVPQEIIDLMKKFRLKPRDAVHLKTMLDNKIKYLLTLDKDFEKQKLQKFVKIIR